MRKIILSMQMSLDGIIEGPKGEVDEIVYSPGEVWNDLFDRLKSVDTFLLGRVMYPAYENYWSAVLKNPSAPQNEIKYARLAAETQHILFSRTLQKVGWTNTRIVKDNIPEEILKLKNQPGKDMMILGGASIASTFINLGLVDEYRILVSPVIFGRGKPLFKDIQGKHNLKLVKAKTLVSGVVLYYEPTES